MSHAMSEKPVAELFEDLKSSPITDPRSIGSSLLIHLLIVLVLSAAVLTVARKPDELPTARVLTGEIGPVDNRAASEPGGGSPGELGGVGVEFSSDRGTPAAPTRNPVAESLLSELLPTRPNATSPPRTTPGLPTSGLGIVPGPGAGGGGGMGGGSGGGIGRGIGPGTEFFGVQERANSFAYVIDCSGSMSSRSALDHAKRELLASLDHLPPDAFFSVVFYNLQATVFTDPSGQRNLMPATAANKARARSLVGQVSADGGTDHMLALRTALQLKPEVIFFLTDADLMTRADVDDIIRQAGKTRIQAVEFGIGSSMFGSEPLQRLSSATGGTYRYVDVMRLGGK
jgi:hypothetical protein